MPLEYLTYYFDEHFNYKDFQEVFRIIENVYLDEDGDKLFPNHYFMININSDYPTLNFLVRYQLSDLILYLIKSFPEAILNAIQSCNHKSILHEMAMLEWEFDDNFKEITI